MGLGLSMMGDLAPGASMPELDPDSTYAEQVKGLSQQKTSGENGITDPTLLKVAQELGYDPNSQDVDSWVDSLSTTITPTAERPSWGDRWAARKATRGSDNPVNPVMDWLSGTDWSQAREKGERPVLANMGPKVLNALSFVNPQIAMLNRLVGLGKSFKKGPKEAGLGLLGSLIGNRFGAQGQNIFNVARDIRSNKSTFKQGIGKLLMGKLLSDMGKNRDVGQGIMSMIGGKDPRQALLKMALGRAARGMDPTQGAIFGAGVQTMQGRPGREAFGSALKNIARRQGMQQLFQRAYRSGGRPAVQKLRAVMSFVPGPP